MSEQIKFVTREDGPKRLLCEAEVHFTDGLLAGLKLVGFCLWQGHDTIIRVTLPARSYTSGDNRVYFDLVRAQDDMNRTKITRELKNRIITAWEDAWPKR